MWYHHPLEICDTTILHSEHELETYMDPIEGFLTQGTEAKVYRLVSPFTDLNRHPNKGMMSL